MAIDLRHVARLWLFCACVSWSLMARSESVQDLLTLGQEPHSPRADGFVSKDDLLAAARALTAAPDKISGDNYVRILVDDYKAYFDPHSSAGRQCRAWIESGGMKGMLFFLQRYKTTKSSDALAQFQGQGEALKKQCPDSLATTPIMAFAQDFADAVGEGAARVAAAAADKARGKTEASALAAAVASKRAQDLKAGKEQIETFQDAVLFYEPDKRHVIVASPLFEPDKRTYWLVGQVRQPLENGEFIVQTLVGPFAVRPGDGTLFENRGELRIGAGVDVIGQYSENFSMANSSGDAVLVPVLDARFIRLSAIKIENLERGEP